MSKLITRLALESHDSELFSFLEKEQVKELQDHPSATTTLWTFGRLCSDDVLEGVTMWCSDPSCLAFTEQPATERTEGRPGRHDGWYSYRGFTTNDDLIQVQALVLIRHLFVQGYTCALDDRQWITRPADRGLERLRYIRSLQTRSVNESTTMWDCMKRDYYWWVFAALNEVPTALGVARMDGMVDRCLDSNQRAG